MSTETEKSKKASARPNSEWAHMIDQTEINGTLRRWINQKNKGKNSKQKRNEQTEKERTDKAQGQIPNGLLEMYGYASFFSCFSIPFGIL